MTETKTQFPQLKWAQRKDRLFITIMVVHTKKPSVEVEGKKLKYKGTDGNASYAFEIELFDEIDKDESKYTLDARNIFLNLHKKTAGPFWPRLTAEKKKFHWIEVDWTYFVEEDEESESKGPNFDGQDLGDIGGEMDEDDVPEPCGCGHDHDHDHKETEEKGTGNDDAKNEEELKKKEEKSDEKGDDKKDEKKADLGDLDKEEEK